MVWRFRFKDRSTEWWVASYSFLYGLVLSLPPVSMGSPSFRTLLAVMPEAAWGTLFLVIGSAHMIALAVNGAGWWTPYARSLAASVNLFAYALIAWGIAVENPASPGVPTYGFLVCGTLGITLFRAARDCFLSHGTRRHGPR